MPQLDSDIEHMTKVLVKHLFILGDHKSFSHFVWAIVYDLIYDGDSVLDDTDVRVRDLVVSEVRRLNSQ